MTSLSDYQVDHLFLLVGGNPLPNYAAARALLKHDANGVVIGKPYFVHSPATFGIAEALLKVFSCSNEHLVAVRDEADAFYIRQALAEQLRKLPERQSCGLHYTGSTKVMAVHSYRASEQGKWDIIYSYLDPRTLTLRIEQEEAPSLRFELLKPNLRDLTKLDAKTLFDLHRIKLYKPPRSTILFPDVTQAIVKRYLEPAGIDGVVPRKKWTDWKTQEWQRTGTFAKCPFPEVVELLMQADPPVTDDKSLLDHYQKVCHEGDPTWSLHDEYARNNARDWITNNGWFEDYVFAAVKSIADDVGLTDISLSVEAADDNDKPYFEVDVIALRGYQLFVWACTVESNRSKRKEKLLEVSIRAKQLGGDEARFALVSFADSVEMVSLNTELRSLLDRHIYRIFGAADLPNLATHIKAWIRQVDRESL